MNNNQGFLGDHSSIELSSSLPIPWAWKQFKHNIMEEQIHYVNIYIKKTHNIFICGAHNLKKIVMKVIIKSSHDLL
jgi:hypothetical protein